MDSADGLLWIGRTYRRVWCGKKESCAPGVLIPGKGGERIPYLAGTHCFVHEAERRGISRKVPNVPDWLVPGRSRIVLAHHGDRTDPGEGLLIGYFTFARAEVLTDPAGYLPPAADRAGRGLQSDGAISGTIRDSQSFEKLRGAVVVARDDGTEIASVKTDERGRYDLAVEAGAYRVEASLPGREPASVKGVQVASGRRIVQDLYVDPAPAITGVVRDHQTSSAIAGATVEVFDNGTSIGTATTGADGRYDVPLAPGTYRLVVSVGGYLDCTVTAVKVVASTRTTEDVDLNPVAIVGVVRDAQSGKKLSNVAVKAFKKGTQVANTSSDTAGNYLLPLPPGKYRLEASRPGYKPRKITGVTVVAAAQTTQDIDLVALPPAAPVGGGAVSGPVKPPTPVSKGPGGRRPTVRRPVKTERRSHATRRTRRSRRGSAPQTDYTKLIDVILEILLEERDCSLRVRPGARYVTDALGAAVTDAAASRMKGRALYRRYAAAATAQARSAVRRQGREQFNRIVDDVRATHRSPRPEDGLDATVYGELVLFRDPPILEHRPVATFRGLAHVDGDTLIEAVKKREKVHVPFAVARQEGRPLKNSQLCAELAAALDPSAAEVERLLVCLAEIARQDLADPERGRFRIGDLGQIGKPGGKHARHRDELVAQLAKGIVDLDEPDEGLSDDDRRDREAAARVEAGVVCRELFKLAEAELHAEPYEFRLPGVGTIKAKKRGGYSLRPYRRLEAPTARFLGALPRSAGTGASATVQRLEK